MAAGLVTAITLLSSSVGLTAGDKKNAIQGTWTLTSFRIDGKEQKVLKVTVTFAAGGKLTSVNDGDMSEGTYKVDDTKMPRHLDISIKRDKDNEKKTPAIYEIAGDTLRMAFIASKGDGGQATRPATFDAKGVLVMTYMRVK